MWIFKYLVCLMYNHSFVNIIWHGSPYQYCLRCGKVEVQDAVTEGISVGDQIENQR